MKEKVLIVHGGGPSAVINSSLYGVIKEARENFKDIEVLAARNGTGGLLREDFIDLSSKSDEEIEFLKCTPGTAIGTSRDDIKEADYKEMVNILEKHKITRVLFNGGNGTMDTCGKLYKMAVSMGKDIKVLGIPKTMDNDIAITDHSPGYGSAALYIAQSVREVCYDVKAMPIHVVVIEASGRNAGWITAAASLAKDEYGVGADLIYLPELAFDENKFLEDVKKLLEVKKGIVVVVSEGLRDKEGKPIVKPIFKTDRATYFGDVSSHLANLIIKELGYKARGEKPGLLGRASMNLQSSIDRKEAELAGRECLKAILKGETGKMLAFRRKDSKEYEIETFFVDIDEVMMFEHTVPREFINEEGNGMTEDFVNWCKPLIGENLTKMISFT